MSKCEMCGKEFPTTDAHHALPRYMGGTDEDIVRVCKICHGRAEAIFTKYILDPFGSARGLRWTDPIKHRLQAKNYRRHICRKTITIIDLDEGWKLDVDINFNERTNNIYTTTHRDSNRHNPNKLDYQLYGFTPIPHIEVRQRLVFNRTNGDVMIYVGWRDRKPRGRCQISDRHRSGGA